MEITLTIPDELARQIIPEGLDPSRQALEDMAVEAYRAHRLTGAQLRRVLGIPSPEGRKHGGRDGTGESGTKEPSGPEWAYFWAYRRKREFGAESRTGRSQLRLKGLSGATRRD